MFSCVSMVQWREVGVTQDNGCLSMWSQKNDKLSGN